METKVLAESPVPDYLVQILAAQTAAIAGQTVALGAIGRLLSSVERGLESTVRVFVEEHGKHETTLSLSALEMRKIHQSLGLLVGEVRGVLKRLGPMELEVANLKDEWLLSRGNGQ